MLDIKGLTAYYGESEILHNIDLSVPDGKIIALVGRNGVGKTTTLKSIMGLVKTPSGSIVEKFLPRKGGDLSGGQQQQLAIARALIAHPKLLLLDEPTEGIQPSVIQEIGDAIRTINRETGLSILLVEQYLDFALELADECYVMDKGQIVLHVAAGKAKKDEIQQYMLAS